MTGWKEIYKSKIMTPFQAVRKIRPGDRIFIGTGCGRPQTLVDALVNESGDIADAEIYNLLAQGSAPYTGEAHAKQFRACSFFPTADIGEAIAAGRADYNPVFLSEIPHLFKSGLLPLDVALIQTSPPDKNGNLSLGISVDIARSAIENSLLIIAEINAKMPRTLGDSFISIDQADVLVESDCDLLEYALPQADAVTLAIARNVASLIEDGSTIEAGIGDIPQAVLLYLDDKNDLGLHTEMFSDGVVSLVERKVVTGAKKTINRGKIIASFCMGTRKLYEFIHENALFEFRPSEYVNDPFVIAQHNKMAAINTAFEIDMAGQASLGPGNQAGVGGLVDFSRGATRSREGKAIIALPSTSPDGKTSRIVPRLSEGAEVVLGRADVHYVVTEYGATNLFGKNVRERVVALAEIAHPDYRNELLTEAKQRNYIYSFQKELPPGKAPYPREFESTRTLTDGTSLFFRPVKPTDAKSLRDMFYSLSEESIAFRFFKSIKSFPLKFIQDFIAIDFSRDMAIAALVQDTGGEQIVAVAYYFLNQSTNRAEASFLVRDDWQAKGIGTDLLEILTDIARKRGVAGFDAKVVAQNQLMLAVFYNSGYRISTKREADAYFISYEFREKQEPKPRVG